MGDYQVPEIKLIDKLTQNDLNPLLDIFCLCAKYEGVKLALPIKNVNVFEQKLQLFPKHSLSNMPDSIYEGRYIDTNEQKISIIKNQYIKAFAALHKIEDINKLTPNLLYSLYRVLNAPESQTKSATPLNKIHRYYTQLNDEGDELELLDKSKIPAKLEELCTYLKLNWDKSSKQMKLFRICVFIMNFSILQPFQNGNDMIANLLLDWLLSLIDIPCARYGYIELFSEAFRKLYSDCLWANRVYAQFL